MTEINKISRLEFLKLIGAGTCVILFGKFYSVSKLLSLSVSDPSNPNIPIANAFNVDQNTFINEFPHPTFIIQYNPNYEGPENLVRYMQL